MATTTRGHQIVRRTGPSPKLMKLQEAAKTMRRRATQLAHDREGAVVEGLTGVAVGAAERFGVMGSLRKVTLGVDPTIPLGALSFIGGNSSMKRIVRNVGEACVAIAGYKLGTGQPVLAGDDDEPSSVAGAGGWVDT